MSVSPVKSPIAKSWWCWILIISIITLIFSSSRVLAAELPHLSVDGTDNPLVIKGTLDKKTTSFSGSIRLTVTGGEIKDLQLLASNLSNISDTSVVIDRSNITIPAGTSLSESQPRDVRLTINNITRPGQYKGNIKFFPMGQTGTKALEVPLELYIDAEPNVIPVTDKLSIQVVRCQIDCWLATWLLPDSVIKNKWTIQLENKTLIPVKITNATVVMQGEKTGNSINNDQIYFSATHQTLESQKVESIPLILRRNQLSPDHYQGTLRFKLENSDDPVNINASIAVRDAPIWALFVIVSGVLVGRLAQDMESSKAQRQVKNMRRYYELYDLAQSHTVIKNKLALEFLHKKFDDIKNKINQDKETDEVIEKELCQLEVIIQFLDDIENLETKLSESDFDALKVKLNPKINEARELLIKGDFEQSQQLLKEVEQVLKQAQTDGSMGIADDLIERLLNTFVETSNKLTDAFQSISQTKLPGGHRWNWLAKFLAALSGIQTINADIRYWLIRPLLWLVLLIVLVLLGLQTLYVNAGANFGVNGFYDYLNLFLWGLSADIANQGLRRLQSDNIKKGGESN